jgi:hypothetical protein
MSPKSSIAVLVAAILAFAAAQVARAADPRIDIEISTEPGFLATGAREWTEMLSQAGFASIRLRGGKGDDTLSIQTRGTEAAPSYLVMGALTADGQLLLPKGKFGLRDRAKIEAWLAKLREGGQEGITVKPAAFGLLPKQLVAVHEALAVPVAFTTKGKQPREVARQIADKLSLKFTTDTAGQTALASEEPVADELQGLSAGTALAALLRPLGLVLVPERAGGETRLRISDSRSAKENWPIGWPVKSNPGQTLPGLFKFLDVEVEQTPLSEVLAAIGGRLKVPLLIDHNSVARRSIDLNQKVDLPKANTFYGRALDQLLIQAKLKHELRIDEADKPFLWITAGGP